VTDRKMPDVDGFDLVKWIRNQKAFAAVPIVMLSSSSEDRDIKRAKELGVDRYLMKLPTSDTLAKIVVDLCERKPRVRSK
jgi:DNA-binding response OmpR family regulator